jgi:predicted enzyme related to lactoylglutathione lyase
MARVTGIGGVFFKARDPEGLQAFYQEHLGLTVAPEGPVVFRWRTADDPPAPGSTVWAPFADDTTYFGPGPASWMVNYRVDDLDGMLAALRAAGIEVDDAVEEMPGLGRFGWAADPEGNRFELWEPAEGM